MNRPMRRRYQQVEDVATLERWLMEAEVGRLATIDENGYPVVKPVNFVYRDGKVFFHSAAAGEKLDAIRRDARVGFEVDRLYAITQPLQRGCQTHCFYQCIIIRGRARLLDSVEEGPARERALRLLVAKYAPDFVDTPLVDVDQTAVVEITIEQISGKEDFGQKWSLERKLTVARVLLERDPQAAKEVIARMGLTTEQVLSS